MDLLAGFDHQIARDRERAMLAAIGSIARGDLHVADVTSERDLRQLAYLASLSRNRVRHGRDNLASFYRDALARLGKPAPIPAVSMDPLKDMLGATYSLDAGKIRSEADLHIGF